MCLAMPGRIVNVVDGDGPLMAEVDFGDTRKQVCLEYTPEARAGDYVVVHVGFAIQQLDEMYAQKILAEAQDETDAAPAGAALVVEVSGDRAGNPARR